MGGRLAERMAIRVAETSKCVAGKARDVTRDMSQACTPERLALAYTCPSFYAIYAPLNGP